MPLTEEEKKQRNRERMRKKYHEKKEAKKLQIKQKEETTEEKTIEEVTPTESTESSVTLEEYVKYLFEQNMKSTEHQVKKNNPKQQQEIPQTPTTQPSGGYSSLLVYLVPALLPFIRVIPELANKYLNSSNIQNTQQSLSLSQLLPQ
jgi:hypothetical protein